MFLVIPAERIHSFMGACVQLRISPLNTRPFFSELYPISPNACLTPELLTACFDRVYVMPEADASALHTGYDAATRVVAMTAYAPDSGSYLVTQ